MFTYLQSPGEIKRREVSWTLTKKLDAFAGPGEIKRREVVLDPAGGRQPWSSGLAPVSRFHSSQSPFSPTRPRP